MQLNSVLFHICNYTLVIFRWGHQVRCSGHAQQHVLASSRSSQLGKYLRLNGENGQDFDWTTSNHLPITVIAYYYLFFN
jgi:hypothetical protein